MKDDTLVAIRIPESGHKDLLTELLRNGAKTLITKAVKAELENQKGQTHCCPT